jgi:hypothetical protein
MRVIPAPPVWSVKPVSPPIWKTRSFEVVVETPVSQGREPVQLGLFACLTGSDGLESNGLAVFAPDIPNATTPYQVSPWFDVVTEIVSELNGLGAMAYHSSKNWLPPMLTVALEWNVSPAVSLTENVDSAEVGKQSQPTMTTSFECAVDRATAQEVTYPQPLVPEPSRAGGVVEAVDVELDDEDEEAEDELDDGAGLIASAMTPKSLP